MKAYGVFAGGGVKGAALAGCLAAAESMGVEFEGFGGTSAGAMVAALAAAGYGGYEIGDLLKGPASPASLFPEGGRELRELRTDFARLTKFFENPSVWGAFDLFWLYGKAKRRYARVIRTLGLHNGDQLRAVMRRLLSAKSLGKSPVTVGQGQGNPTFGQFAADGGKLLKIVASDTRRHCALVYSDDADTRDTLVIEAVRASAGYPFVFQPLELPDGGRLVDGGLASNLPSFLFAEERMVRPYPVLAFDLDTEPAETFGDYGLIDYLKDLMGTALEASDQLFVGTIPGVSRIPVPISREISTFKIDLKPKDVEDLFNAGHRATTEFLNGFEPLQIAQKAADEIQKQLQVQYGNPKLFEPPLAALKMMMEDRTNACDVRTHIMVPTGRPCGSRIVLYGFGFRDDDADRALELREFAGCSGEANRQWQPIAADLEQARIDFREWEMTEEQQARVPPDRKSMISTPVFASPFIGGGGSRERPVRAILSVDSSTPLADTGWVEGGRLALESRDRITEWADVIARLIS